LDVVVVAVLVERLNEETGSTGGLLPSCEFKTTIDDVCVFN
jgi:hypothetical protein